jgi:hypothetical protein
MYISQPIVSHFFALILGSMYLQLLVLSLGFVSFGTLLSAKAHIFYDHIRHSLAHLTNMKLCQFPYPALITE